MRTINATDLSKSQCPNYKSADAERRWDGSRGGKYDDIHAKAYLDTMGFLPLDRKPDDQASRSHCTIPASRDWSLQFGRFGAVSSTKIALIK